MNRRCFLQTALSAALSGIASAKSENPRILLRSSWQVVNIGDIAHTPGVLALLEKYLPGAEVRLWASGDLTEEVAAMEHVRFPSLKIVKGTIDTTGKASTAELQQAIDWCDFLLHGSGAGFVAAKDVDAFVKSSAKPFGIYGITYASGTDETKTLLSKAKFVFFRDSPSLAKAREDGVESPTMDFGPDGAFACDLRDEERAQAFLKEHGLQAQKFVCCIPRYRYTPYWDIRARTPRDPKRAERNEAMKEIDHAKLREAIIAVLRGWDGKVLVCPEDMTQVQLGKDLLVDRLPPELRDRVVWRDRFWLTAEALSVYVRSAGLFGFEMHSPIMCVGNGVPAIVCRFAEQTSKGMMWKDIGLGEWLFDLDEEKDGSRIATAALGMVKDPAAALVKVKAAQAVVVRRQQETMAVVARSATAV